MTARFPVAEGMTLAADVHGPWNGPAVVLLHGGGQTRHAWGATALTLAGEGYLGVALDLRGHGESDWAPDGDYGISAYAADLFLRVDVGTSGDDHERLAVGEVEDPSSSR